MTRLLLPTLASSLLMLVSAFSEDGYTSLFNGNTNTGNTYYLDNVKVVKHVADPTYTAGTLFEDYETVHNVSYVTANGTYLATQNNPAATGVNTSAHVAKYTRNSTSTYDALTLANGPVIFNELRIAGFWVSRWFERTPADRLAAMISELAGLVRAGDLHLPVAEIIPLAEITRALALAADPGRRGKVLLDCR